MNARAFGVNLSHEFFSYLTDKEKQEIYADLDYKMSVIYSFEETPYNPIFAAVIDVLDDRIHVREVGGAFAFKMKNCEALCEILCAQFDKTIISFCTLRPAVETIGKRLGYKPSKYDHEYEKKVA